MKNLHSWNLSYQQARNLQEELACKVVHTPLKRMPGTVAGIDCAFSKDGEKILAAVIVLKCGTGFQPVNTRSGPTAPPANLPSAREFSAWPRHDFGDFEIIETASAVQKVTFPYIPGLLSFREAPVCIAAVEKLAEQPDVFIIDGQGIAHPRRLGLAAHLGLFFNKPTIGCAKSRLIGKFDEPPREKGRYSLLTDSPGTKRRANREQQPASNEIIGAVLRTRANVKPVFVSVGHKCLLEDAIRITLACATKYRLPEPTRLAHQLVNKLKLKA
ncbi:MAG: endonuclease V [Sedimentisphaerales bacterium]|nr:endonuclease V [Sedimentisphaerales bacterium]